MDKEKILRINELAKKKKSTGLTPQEENEQKLLYKEYIAQIRGNMENQLKNMVIEQPDGSRLKVEDFKKNKNKASK